MKTYQVSQGLQYQFYFCEHFSFRMQGMQLELFPAVSHWLFSGILESRCLATMWYSLKAHEIFHDQD